MKKMSLIILSTLTLINPAAHATSIFNNLLEYKSMPGFVAPQFAVTHICTITLADVQTRAVGRIIDFPHTIHKAIKYTNDVPNITVAQSLVSEASNRKPVKGKGPIPMDAGSETYGAFVSASKEIFLLNKTGPAVTQKNPSEAASKLVAFMVKNCN